MALATRPKPKTHAKKRQARHHRQSRVYLKTYWPYLPIVGIVAAGYFANNNWPVGLVKLDGAAGSDLTRIEAMAGNQNESMFLLILAIAAVAGGVVIISQWYRVRRALNQGEMFVVEHPWFDIAMVGAATAGFVLTRFVY
jgi:uncharacterized membrane protein (UPF0182 family)